jgi:hypothetical protein
VIAGRKTLDVQTADAPGSQDHGFGGHHDKPLVVQILEDGTRTGAVLIAQQLDRRTELEQVDLLIQHFVFQHPHDLEAGIIRAGQQPRLRTASALLDMQIAVRVSVEQHTQLQQPFRNGRPFFDHHLQQLVFIFHMATLERIHEVLDGRILVGDRHLNAALRHHGIGISQTQFRRQQDLHALCVRVQRGSTAGSASADYKNVRGVSRREIEIDWDGTVAFEQGGQFANGPLAGIGTEFDRPVGAFAMVRMVYFDECVAFSRRILRQRLGAPMIAGFVDDFLKFVDFHTL